MTQPNVILIVSDQHNSKVMGNQGDPYIRTPNLDKLAERGTSFTNCYCASPLCVPSRSAFLTGQLPINTQVLNNHQSLHPDRATLAHGITNAGYESVLAGRMHFTGEDQCHGFEQRLVGDLTPFYQGYDFMEANMGDMYKAFLPGPSGVDKIGAGMTGIYHFDNDVVVATETFLREREDERPLFLTVGLSSPHPPYVCEKESYDYYYDRLPDEGPWGMSASEHEAIREFQKLRKMDQLDQEDFRKIRAAYYGLVELLDTNVGRLLDAIDGTLGLDNTIIIYTSDHGDHLGHKGMIWKGSFLEDSVKVPLIISSPTKYYQDHRADDPVSLLDLTRTMIQMTGAEALPSMDGSDLTDYLIDEHHREPERCVVAQIGSYPVTFVPSAMVRKGKYKLIKYHGYEAVTLYDLHKDPNEENDLGQEKAYMTVIEELSLLLEGKWNSDVAKHISSYTRDHYKIINKWSHVSRYSKRDNWQGNPEDNYLVEAK